MSIRHIHRRLGSQHATELHPLVHLWILRLLVPLMGYKKFIYNAGFADDQIAELIGLGKWVECTAESEESDREWDSKLVLRELKKRYQTGEQSLRNAQVPECLAANVQRLASIAGLTEAECRILEFAALIHTESMLDDTADLLGNQSSNKVASTLAVVLDLPESDIRHALAPDSALNRSGLITLDRSCSTGLRGKLDLLSHDFADTILSAETDPLNLLRETVIPSSPPELEMADFIHLDSHLTPIVPYLKKSLATGRRGVNLFLHGIPGTGKNQLVKVLAQELGCELFEVSSQDGDGDSIDGNKRLRSFRAAQSFLGQRRAMILFDEVEDVFNDGGFFAGRRSTAQNCKAWINRMLEDNPVPTLWLSNTLNGLDRAFIRRFDTVIHLPIPPKKQRIKILQESCGDLLDAPTLARIAEADHLAPALITKTAGLVRTIRDELGEAGSISAIETLLNTTLEAQGHRPILKNDPNRLPEVYDPRFIHADANLSAISEGLIHARSGRLCLFGPPGTGKTAYARWLAQQLEMPLHIKRASDLISMWIGETEKNIVKAFQNAEREGALLLIDEVDSFLQDRRCANRSWEVSLVNEILTQMESFSGVFIASTNLMEGLDQAALRRFDLKVRFDFLRPEQAWALLECYCDSLGLAAPGKSLEYRLTRLPQLTPGDFATVLRQNRFRKLENPEQLVAALEAECALKEGNKGAIGFI